MGAVVYLGYTGPREVQVDGANLFQTVSRCVPCVRCDQHGLIPGPAELARVDKQQRGRQDCRHAPRKQVRSAQQSGYVLDGSRVCQKPQYGFHGGVREEQHRSHSRFQQSRHCNLPVEIRITRCTRRQRSVSDAQN